MFCKAKATCPALTKHTMTLAADDFTDLTIKPKFDNAIAKIETIDNKKLSWYMQNLGLIEDWISAVRARAELELLQGREVPGFKLVEGRKGGRKWSDETAVAEAMKESGVPPDLIYTKEIISVAQAEKLTKKDKKTWVKLHDFITQTDGKPSVAPSTDPRPALNVGKPEDDFMALGN